MQSFQLKNETLIDWATFLLRRWSGKDTVNIEFSDRIETRTRLKENRVILPSINKLLGNDFHRYRQFRTTLWYEAMRIHFCDKILSNDHAFGFILNTLETRRVEYLGRQIWKGMDEEIIFNYTFMWIYRPMLHDIYGKARIVEAFYQYFLFGAVKGEIQASHFERIIEASKYAEKIVKDAIKNQQSTSWMEGKIGEIIKILDIDSLLTIPIGLPFLKAGMALNENELKRFLIGISKNREGDFGKIDPKAVLKGESVFDEYKVILDEHKKNENLGIGEEQIGIQIPSDTNVDESIIYDLDLINNLKIKFRDWKTTWREQHFRHGDEFDEETYLENQEPFFTDVKKSINVKMTILLDHSSSISSEALEYKKATLALCELLTYLKVKFSVYAFSTVNKSVVCWLIKPDNAKWNSLAAKRLVQVIANGSTPLADVYSKMFQTLQAKRPEIFLTLTDGEPSDPNAVRIMIKSLKSLGIKMVALGLGSNIIRSTTIANNLKHLGYEKVLAVSKLHDIPSKVVGILGDVT